MALGALVEATHIVEAHNDELMSHPSLIHTVGLSNHAENAFPAAPKPPETPSDWCCTQAAAAGDRVVAGTRNQVAEREVEGLGSNHWAKR